MKWNLLPGRKIGDAPAVVLAGHFPWLQDDRPRSSGAPIRVLEVENRARLWVEPSPARVGVYRTRTRDLKRVGMGDYCKTDRCSNRSAVRGGDYCNECLEENDE
jgi:hypothetical protein